MRKIVKPFQWLFIGITLSITLSCAELEAVLQEIPASSERALTTDEVAKGLKEALYVGVDTAVSQLATNNGYFGHADVRITLPPDAQTMVENIERIPGGPELVEKLVRNINRSAEEAAHQVVPLFVKAIRQMTIQDAWGILNGKPSAATDYLYDKTYEDLYELYKPKISQATQRQWVASISAQKAWNSLTAKWNTLAGSMVGQLAGYNRVEVDLDDYLTQQALEGLFLRIQEEEASIRKQTQARVTPLLERVFGGAL